MLHPLISGRPYPLCDEVASRLAEASALGRSPDHALMAKAGVSLARLAMALTPHGRLYWIACGPGNNGGDGLVAALHLHRSGRAVWVSRADHEPPAGSDATWALGLCRDAGLPIHPEPPSMPWDLALDALYGLGARPGLPAHHAQWLRLMRRNTAPLLCADVPSGLSGSTGIWTADPDDLVRPSGQTHTLSLLTLKTGLFTGSGRDAAGKVWLDDLGATDPELPGTATLLGAPPAVPPRLDSHKGQFGSVWVVGGDHGMAGAAWLAGQSALRRGAGRVHVCLLAPEDAPPPRPLALMSGSALPSDLTDLTLVAGCGGGPAIAKALPRIVSAAPRLVLDADALNAIAKDHSLQSLLSQRRPRQRPTVLTPHPLEAARLLNGSTAQVQANRLDAARRLAQETGCVVVLKGSGSVVADPDGRLAINPTGNNRLATAGSGDVLAGWIGARLARGDGAWEAACAAVYLHGLLAEQALGDGPLIADEQ